MSEHGLHCACFAPLTAKVDALTAERDDLALRLDAALKELAEVHGGPAMTHAFRLERNAARTERDEVRAEMAEVEDRNRLLQQSVNTNAELVIQLRAKVNEHASRLDECKKALSEIYDLSYAVERQHDDMTIPEINTIALGALQEPVVERQKP